VLKRGIIAVILFSMVLHSASRVGFLSYLYQQRHQIAHSLGFIDQVPVAVCNSDYDFNHDLTIASADESDSTLPSAMLMANEIHLFFIKHTVDIRPQLNFLRENTIPGVVERIYLPPTLSIFHPPS
jgi:hypothetical protein